MDRSEHRPIAGGNVMVREPVMDKNGDILMQDVMYSREAYASAFPNRAYSNNVTMRLIFQADHHGGMFSPAEVDQCIDEIKSTLLKYKFREPDNKDFTWTIQPQ